MTVRALTLSVRSLRESARAKTPYFMRGLLISTLVLAVWTAHEASWRTNIGGSWLLWWIGWANFFLVSILAASAFSSVITEEKELMTLGLLRLAGFTPGSILLGKSIGLLISVLLLLVVQVPFCMLAITLGGVTMDQIVSVFAMLLGYTLFCYGLAMLCSVVRRRNSTAAAMTMGILVGYHVVPNIVRALIYQGFGMMPGGFVGEIVWFCEAWWGTSAMAGLAAVTSSLGSFRGISFVEHTLVNVGMAVALFGASWFLFERFNRNELPSAPKRSGLLPWQRGGGSRRSQRSFANALFWKDYRFLTGGKRALVVRAVFYAAFFVVVGGIAGSSMRLKGMGEFMMGSMLVAIVLELGIQAGRVFQQEVKAKTLGAIMALPHSLGYVAASKIGGAAILALPAIGYFVLGALLAPLEFERAIDELFDEPGAWFLVSETVMGLFLTTYYSLRLSRGALALALATVIVGNMIFGLLFFGFGSASEAVFGLGIPVMIILCFALARGIRGRLLVLAAED